MNLQAYSELLRLEASWDFAGSAALIVAPGPIEGPLMARQLRAWGAKASIAVTPAAAEQSLRDGRFDAVIIDGAVGRSAVERIAASIRRADTRAIVLIAPLCRLLKLVPPSVMSRPAVNVSFAAEESILDSLSFA